MWLRCAAFVAAADAATAVLDATPTECDIVVVAAAAAIVVADVMTITDILVGV